jgi:hypothetical protein
MYLEGMGPRQSIATELLDTVRFGGLNKIKGATGYSKKQVDRGDAYVIPFGTSSQSFGAILVRAPNKIEVKTSVNGKRATSKFRYAYEVKKFLIWNFIQEF